jgi:F-type H+-transporting ATPase subunit b
MLIDWFTVGAQALNFLILVWLMRRFLYRPILQAIDAREQLIAKELAAAATMKSEAGRERDEFTQKSGAFAAERAALLAQAVEEAGTERRRLLDAAGKAADAMATARQDLLNREVRDLHAGIGRRAQDEVFAIARKTLSELANDSLEEHLTAAFVRRLRDLPEPARTDLGNALRGAQAPALVRSALELPAAQRGALQEAINVLCSSDIRLRFAAAPEAIAGIELTCSGNKVSWSIDGYLTSLERAVEDLLQKQARQAPKAASAADAPHDRVLADEATHDAAAAALDPAPTPAPAAVAAATVAPARAPHAPPHPASPDQARAASEPPAIAAAGAAAAGPAAPIAGTTPSHAPQRTPA